MLVSVGCIEDTGYGGFRGHRFWWGISKMLVSVGCFKDTGLGGMPR